MPFPASSNNETRLESIYLNESVISLVQTRSRKNLWAIFDVFDLISKDFLGLEVNVGKAMMDVCY